MTTRTWLDNVINEAQKEVDSWDSSKKESIQREVEKTHQQSMNTSSTKHSANQIKYN